MYYLEVFLISAPFVLLFWVFWHFFIWFFKKALTKAKKCDIIKLHRKERVDKNENNT